MARKPDVSPYKNFEQITERLREIVAPVRDRETSLERSLDLFDEAIALGTKAVGMVDATDFSPEEEARLAAAAHGGDEADAATGYAAEVATNDAQGA